MVIYRISCDDTDLEFSPCCLFRTLFDRNHWSGSILARHASHFAIVLANHCKKNAFLVRIEPISSSFQTGSWTTRIITTRLRYPPTQRWACTTIIIWCTLASSKAWQAVGMAFTPWRPWVEYNWTEQLLMTQRPTCNASKTSSVFHPKENGDARCD